MLPTTRSLFIIGIISCFFSCSSPKPEQEKKLIKFTTEENIQLPANARLVYLPSDVTFGLIEEISKKYANKVIYIDFWATWCKPCLAEMPYSNIIQDYFQGKEVVFLFLASRSKKDVWKYTIANGQMAGDHILLTDVQMDVLSHLLEIQGIPHYTLIDKEGAIQMQSAPRPSEKGKLIIEIEKLL